ncbi:hypothetical protein ABID97_001955 [Variovorax sp. OAS795]|uniref:hypothetical protein n=1 Tax=Variovorax sp. OAS795 TaxID=3034231 RepID=UPI003399B0A1
MTNSNGSDLFAGMAGSDTINSGNGEHAGGSGARNDSPNGGTSGWPMCREGPREGKQMSDDSPVEVSEWATRRVAYAAKITELQYKQAKRICDQINGVPVGNDDAMVLAVLKAISTNYVAVGRAPELRLCSHEEAAEIDAHPPRFTAPSRTSKIR